MVDQGCRSSAKCATVGLLCNNGLFWREGWAACCSPSKQQLMMNARAAAAAVVVAAGAGSLSV